MQKDQTVNPNKTSCENFFPETYMVSAMPPAAAQTKNETKNREKSKKNLYNKVAVYYRACRV